MDTCSGAVVIALERSYFPNGVERRGGPKETPLADIKLPTPFNQIEAAMSYSRGLPLMVIVEQGLKMEGLLERGYDWYVQIVKPDPAALTTLEFNGILSDWKAKLTQRSTKPTPKNPGELTLGELFSSMKPSQLWSLLGAIAALVAGAFALGAKFFPK